MNQSLILVHRLLQNKTVVIDGKTLIVTQNDFGDIEFSDEIGSPVNTPPKEKLEAYLNSTQGRAPTSQGHAPTNQAVSAQQKATGSSPAASAPEPTTAPSPSYAQASFNTTQHQPNVVQFNKPTVKKKPLRNLTPTIKPKS